jgi:K+-transporting ATPase ATPase C chain
MNDMLRQLLTGLRALAVLTVLLGIAYPVVVWGIGQTAFGDNANGSLIVRGDKVVGSSRIGQTFAGDDWFASRPSAADYDALASAGSNAGPSDTDLIDSINQSRVAIAKRDGVPAASVPPDALTASGSGLDAYISPAYAAVQTNRVAKARNLTPQRVTDLVTAHTQGRILGFLGEPRVNVLELNLALAQTG